MNRILCKSSESMEEIPDESVHLVVTSPPYNCGQEYEQDRTFDDWQVLMRNVFTEVYRLLIPSGRACVVIANTGRSPYRPLHLHLTQIMLDLGFLMRGEIIWDKGPSVGSSTAWGSWRKVTNPSLRDQHEYILVFSKGVMRREPTGASTSSRDEFLEATLSVWRIPTVSAKKIGHPCPFPWKSSGASLTYTHSKVTWCSTLSSEADRRPLLLSKLVGSTLDTTPRPGMSA
jgi:modification methylase